MQLCMSQQHNKQRALPDTARRSRGWLWGEKRGRKKHWGREERPVDGTSSGPPILRNTAGLIHCVGEGVGWNEVKSLQPWHPPESHSDVATAPQTVHWRSWAPCSCNTSSSDHLISSNHAIRAQTAPCSSWTVMSPALSYCPPAKPGRKTTTSLKWA